MAKGVWRAETDEEGDFVYYHGAYDRGSNDEAAIVYLPIGPRKRKKALDAIVRALNDSGSRP